MPIKINLRTDCALTYALRISVLGPIPIPRVVAPPPLLPYHHVAGVAVELDHRARGEGEGGLAAVRRGGEGAAGDHWKMNETCHVVSLIFYNGQNYASVQCGLSMLPIKLEGFFVLF